MIQLLIGQLESTQYAPDTKGFQNGKLRETREGCPCWLLKPQSTYRDRGEIGVVYLAICPLRRSVHHNFECDGTYVYSEREFPCTSHPHQPVLILPLWWNVRQKVAIGTLFTLWLKLRKMGAKKIVQMKGVLPWWVCLACLAVTMISSERLERGGPA